MEYYYVINLFGAYAYFITIFILPLNMLFDKSDVSLFSNVVTVNANIGLLPCIFDSVVMDTEGKMATVEEVVIMQFVRKS